MKEEKTNLMGQGQAKRNTEKQRQPFFFYAQEEKAPGAGQQSSNIPSIIS